MKQSDTTTNTPNSRRKVTLPEMLTESLRQETRYDYHWCSAVKVVSWLAYGAGVSMLLVVAYLTSRPFSGPILSCILLTSLLLLSLGMITSEAYFERKRKQERLITKLQNHAVAVGPALMLMHQEQDGEILKAAAQVLKSHLPMLRETNYGDLNAHQRASLCFVVRSADPDLSKAAISALKYVGDERAIRPLMAIMESKNTTSTIRESALASLEAIRLRAANNRQALSLLRAGPASVALPSSLLRSSDGAAEMGTDLLVRAVK